MLKVKNWSKFQHYKRRRPPWIKLHRDLLDDYEFSRLPLASAALAPRIWLLASESQDGSIPSDPVQLAFRFRCTEPEVVEGVTPLISAGFLEGELDASKALAQRKQVATPETERERETETEGEKRIAPATAVAVVHASDWNREAAEDFKAAYGGSPPKQFFAQVHPVAKRFGWARTRPALQAYMSETPLEYLNVAKCLAVRVEAGNGTRGSPQSNKRLAGIKALMEGGTKGDGT